MHLYVYYGIIYNSWDIEVAQMSMIDEWIKFSGYIQWSSPQP